MSPVDLGRAFLEALRLGDEEGLWQLFSEDARLQILALGDRIGVPADVVARMRLGTALAAERTAFLVDVLEGIRADFSTTDISLLVPELAHRDDGRIRVALVQPIDGGPGFTLPPIPAGWLRLVGGDGAWSIEHLEVPR